MRPGSSKSSILSEFNAEWRCVCLNSLPTRLGATKPMEEFNYLRVQLGMALRRLKFCVCWSVVMVIVTFNMFVFAATFDTIVQIVRPETMVDGLPGAVRWWRGGIHWRWPQSWWMSRRRWMNHHSKMNRHSSRRSLAHWYYSPSGYGY